MGKRIMTFVAAVAVVCAMASRVSGGPWDRDGLVEVWVPASGAGASISDETRAKLTELPHVIALPTGESTGLIGHNVAMFVAPGDVEHIPNRIPLADVPILDRVVSDYVRCPSNLIGTPPPAGSPPGATRSNLRPGQTATAGYPDRRISRIDEAALRAVFAKYPAYWPTAEGKATGELILVLAIKRRHLPLDVARSITEQYHLLDPVAPTPTTTTTTTIPQP